jgi:ATP-dependent Clp protease ATP-binding subunit ClpX
MAQRMTNLSLERKNFEEFINALPLLSPREIYERLEELGYRGQERGRQSVSLMAYRHIKRLKAIHADGVKRDKLPAKTNYLLMGPTGCGKTFLVELLFQKILQIPTVIIDITSFTESGTWETMQGRYSQGFSSQQGETRGSPHAGWSA